LKYFSFIAPDLWWAKLVGNYLRLVLKRIPYDADYSSPSLSQIQSIALHRMQETRENLSDNSRIIQKIIENEITSTSYNDVNNTTGMDSSGLKILQLGHESSSNSSSSSSEVVESTADATSSIVALSPLPSSAIQVPDYPTTPTTFNTSLIATQGHGSLFISTNHRQKQEPLQQLDSRSGLREIASSTYIDIESGSKISTDNATMNTSSSTSITTIERGGEGENDGKVYETYNDENDEDVDDVCNAEAAEDFFEDNGEEIDYGYVLMFQ
jgi:hypothetical protein